MKKAILLVSVSFFLFSFNTLVTLSSGQPPSGYNGEFGFYCNACHTSYGLNSGGGQVFATGLPAGGYTPGATYPFSITISHGSADRTRWGFEIAARNQVGSPVGDFTPGPGTTLTGPAELGHASATFTAPASAYTYTGLAWTAPASPTADDVVINFYMAGNAANGNGANDQDYIYSNSTTISLPVKFNYFRVALREGNLPQLEWQTAQESNSAFFIIERSTDGLTFSAIDSVAAAGNSSVPRSYRYTDAWPRVYDRAIFYRLKQTDHNGRFLYSAIEKILIPNNGAYIRNIAPNPVKWGQPFYAEVVSDRWQGAQVVLANLQGTVVYSESVQLLPGTNALHLNPMAYLPAGHYFLSIRNERFRQRVSLLVQ